MASIFTYQDEPHRMHSPWSTPGSTTPQIAVHVQGQATGQDLRPSNDPRVTKLEPEKHDGPIEYKLHLLLRWRRTFTYSSTTMPAWANQHGRLESVSAGSPSTVEIAVSRTTSQPSTQNRQARLQQLTTQLLWRLQQSSPFHSSSNAKLILPVLPEATPRLGVPEKPAKLIPGLEESQGALYEIGVADDGTLVGLADEELEESLVNLRAMAASLGCVVDIHRRVIVGDCIWEEDATDDQAAKTRTSKLWVAEVLVRPDNKSVQVVPAVGDEALTKLDAPTMQEDTDYRHLEAEKAFVRVTLMGGTAAGKSSLLGTLTTSVLDNGRGKSRLSLLKHRHEIASGITSSVAQELLGYKTPRLTSNIVVNYATGDISSWPDIHNLAERLVFVSDSPGLPRYSKSTFRAVFSWNPAWIILCIPADEVVPDNAACETGSTQPGTEPLSEPSLSLAHLELCLKLRKPFVVVITKMDLATKTGLKHVLGHILSKIKAAAQTPLLINAPGSISQKSDDLDFSANINDLVRDEQERIAEKAFTPGIENLNSRVPILMTSSVTGTGIASLHAVLQTLPKRCDEDKGHGFELASERMFRIDEVFAIPPSKVYTAVEQRALTDGGLVLCGIQESGRIALGDELVLGPFVSEASTGEPRPSTVLRRTSSHYSKSLAQSLPRSFSQTFSRSLQLNGHDTSTPDEIKVVSVRVRVVSLRNLRLPVSVLQAGDTGTVGIQTTEKDGPPGLSLHKTRKGMVLTDPRLALQGYRSFTAKFPHSDFGGANSPSLILGGHAIAYIHTIRAAVKVTAVALEDETPNYQNSPSSTSKRSPTDEVFSFEDDNDEDWPHDEQQVKNSSNLEISFKFTTTVEYLSIDDQVLIVPNATPAGPVAGPASTSSIAGFSGFVGTICGMHA